MHKAAFAGFNGRTQSGMYLYDAIVAASLTTNLQVCLDAGDPASWPGSGLKWLDRSGNGYDFFLGTDGTTAAPTFVGQSGNKHSYWLHSGSSYFTYDTTNEAWMQTLHKNNAVLSAVGIVYRSTGAGAIFGDYGNLTTGYAFGQSLSRCQNATATVNSSAGDVTPTNNTWNFSGVSFTEATGSGGGFLYLNGGYNQVGASNTFDSTYSSPAAGDATSTMQISASGGASSIAPVGARYACVAIWSGTAISKANMDTLYAYMNGRYPIG